MDLLRGSFDGSCLSEQRTVAVRLYELKPCLELDALVDRPSKFDISASTGPILLKLGQ